MSNSTYASSDIRHPVHASAVDRLPASAAEKLFDLGHVSDEAWSALDGATRRFESAYQVKLATESRLREVEQQFATLPPMKEFATSSEDGRVHITRKRADEKLEEAKKALDGAKAAVETFNAIREGKSEAWERARRTFDATSDFIRAAAADDQTFVALPVEADRRALAKPAEALDKQRETIAQLKADLRRIEAAPVPSSFAKDKGRRQLAEMARLARPNVSELVEGNGAISWRKDFVQIAGLGDKVASASAFPIVNAVGLIALLLPDQLAAAVDAEIDAISDDANALAPDDRRREEARLAAEILQAERLEEALVAACEAAGIFVERRPDAAPMAILGVEIETTEIENAA